MAVRHLIARGPPPASCSTVQRLRTLCSRPSGTILVSRRSTSQRLVSREDGADSLGPPRSVMRAGSLREITLALAPADRPYVELPAKQIADLDALYELLVEPLPPEKTQLDKRIRRQEMPALDAEEFFGIPGHNRYDPEVHALRIRSLGVQGELQAAHAALQEMRTMGVEPDANCYAALTYACAECGDVSATGFIVSQS